jgi:Lrp/AsnC family transcriptional regulator, leucine-responsive regulatory protein
MSIANGALDKADVSILRLLQSDGRLSNARIAEQVNLSETPCWRRLKRLESEGYIQGYQAMLNRRKLGFDVLAFVLVSLGKHRGEEPVAFEEQVARNPQILSCHNVTGESDYLLQVVAPDLDAYGQFVSTVLRQLPGVTAIRSLLSLREIKQSMQLPIPGAVE